jgi:hypothetical protein
MRWMTLHATWAAGGVMTNLKMENSMELKDMVKDQEKRDALLYALDDIARDLGGYDYGLPMHHDVLTALMREAIYRWATSEATNAKLRHSAPAETEGMKP